MKETLFVTLLCLLGCGESTPRKELPSAPPSSIENAAQAAVNEPTPKLVEHRMPIKAGADQLSPTEARIFLIQHELRLNGKLEDGTRKKRDVEIKLSMKNLEWSDCVRAEPLPDPATATMSWTIGSDGVPKDDASVSSTELKDQAQQCLLKVLKAMRFKTSALETSVTWNIEFTK